MARWSGGDAPVSMREGLRLRAGPAGTLALAAALLPGMAAPAPAQAPDAGVPFEDPRVQAVESRLRCSCGCNLDIWSCQRQMACDVSASMAAEVRRRLARGEEPEAILAAFVAERGQSVLMAPQKRGFNWVGYLLPFAALGAGAAAVFLVVRRWTAAAEEGAAARRLTEEELGRVEAELARLEEGEG